MTEQGGRVKMMSPKKVTPAAAALSIQPRSAPMLKIAYFVHNLSDATVQRRVQMLKAGGADVMVLGFRRANHPPLAMPGVQVFELGETRDFALAERTVAVLRQALQSPLWRRRLDGCTLFLARSLELLALAATAKATAAPNAELVYECLDIHRRMLEPGLVGHLLRALERSLLARSKLLIVSSPAFLDQYFVARQRLSLKSALIENKPLTLDVAEMPPTCAAAPGPPWRIGWFGMIRCAKSLRLLCDLVLSAPGRYEVIIRGRPTLEALPDFERLTTQTPGLSYGGAYQTKDLQALYSSVHLSWAIDYFEEGLNSSWLLPNRIYEGGLYNVIPIADRNVETGRWLEQHELGLLMDNPEADLKTTLGALTPERYRELFRRAEAAPRNLFQATTADCRAVVDLLAEAAAA